MQLLTDVIAANRAGEARGIYAVCSAHPMVLEACLEQAQADGSPLLIEATSNQVNQLGGYTGRTPEQFRAEVEELAAKVGFRVERIILGGDHLGPNPWRDEPAPVAMEKACAMVAAFAEAGFGKIHLDASMGCAGDPVPLPDDVIAARAARLAAAAEAAAVRSEGGARPLYVIGTEVPTPGGAAEEMETVAVSRVEDLERTIELHEAAFAAAGLEGAWERVIAVVVQPGVEFGHAQVIDFVPGAADALKTAIEAKARLVFEAHSTDYQTEPALQALVASHFAILKVGPGLTFALREALFALAAIEAEWLPAEEQSNLRSLLDEAMLRNPSDWARYYHGTAEEQAFARVWSLSDRSRYYWPDPSVAAAVDRLIANLEAAPIPFPLLSQYLPVQHAAIRAGRLANAPRALIRAKVREVAQVYARACGVIAGSVVP